MLETARLRLLPVTLDDAAAIQAIFPQWEVVRWMDGEVPWPYPDDGARHYLETIVMPAMDAGRAWHWSIRPRCHADRLIGYISLADTPDNNRGFWLDPDWQGQGLMTEASDAVTDYWFDVLDREVLRIPKAVDNPASRRISEKRGMRVVSTSQKKLVSGVHEIELWEIGRDEWYRRTAR